MWFWEFKYQDIKFENKIINFYLLLLSCFISKTNNNTPLTYITENKCTISGFCIHYFYNFFLFKQIFSINKYLKKMKYLFLIYSILLMKSLN